jgi:peptide deformylase
MKKLTNPVTEIDGKVKKLIDDMFESMYNADGIGLAANQVGESLSIITIDTAPAQKENEKKNPPIALINPILEEVSENESDYQEGCLSVPDLHEKVIRPVSIQVRYYNENAKEKVLNTDGILARVIQHEIDHLSGILFYERLTPIRRTLVKNKLKNIQKGKIIPAYPMILPDGTRIEGKVKE